MAKPIVAVVGRPNVGKSTLFNKLIGQRISIVEDTPGVTRDRIFGDCEWKNRSFTLVDTGGIEPYSDDVILSQMRRQAELAIDSADVIIFVTDLKTGMVSTDEEVAAMLQRSNRPVVLCVNKCDKIGEPPAEIYEFYNLGLGDPIGVSAVHGHGTGDLLDAVFEYFPPEEKEEKSDRIKVAVIGKPNAGKSSLINKITGQERSIVSNIAGTTRDAIDSEVENKFGKYTFIDTAGLRRKSRVDDNIEKYSVLRANMAIERADVCVIMIDATEGFTEQDSKVAGLACEQGKACIIAVNKWDAVEEKSGKTMTQYRKSLEVSFSFMSYAPIIFISAKTGQRLDRLFELINYVAEMNSMRIGTGMLNDLLADATARVQPPSDKGKRLKIYYMTQASTKPPTFVCFVNRAELFHFSYQRYLENRIRETFGMEGTPVRFIIRERGEKNKR